MSPSTTPGPEGELAAIARRQHGVISRAQAGNLGVTDRQIDRRLAQREWLRLLSGVYAMAGGPMSWWSWAWAGLLAAGPGAVLVGSSAAALREWTPATWPITVAVPAERRPRWVTQRLNCLTLSVPADDVVIVSGLATTSRLRTALDIAHLLPIVSAQEILDRMLVLGAVELDALTALISTSRRYGSRQARLLMRNAADAAASEAERLAHRILRSAGLGGWSANYDVQVNGRILTIDIAFVTARIAIEIKGWAFHAAPDRQRGDDSRLIDLQLAGWLVIPLSWHDLIARPEWVVARIDAALAARAPA